MPIDLVDSCKIVSINYRAVGASFLLLSKLSRFHHEKMSKKFEMDKIKSIKIHIEEFANYAKSKLVVAIPVMTN